MEQLPPSINIADILVLTPVELIVSKLVLYHNRRGTPKSFTDRRDLAVLMLKFPELKTESGAVADRFNAMPGSASYSDTWREVVSQDIQLDDDDEFSQ